MCHFDFITGLNSNSYKFLHQISKMKSTNFLYRKIVPLILIGVIIFPYYIIAQSPAGANQNATSTETTREESQTKQELQPIPASDIPANSEETIKQLDEIQDKLKPLEGINEIQQSFKDLTVESDQLERQLNETSLEELKYNRLLSFQTNWENIKTSISAWQSQLQTRSQELETLDKILKEKQKLWQKTREASMEREDPEAIQTRIKEVIDSILVIDDLLKIRQEAVLTLLDEVSRESIRINKAQAKIKEAQAENREKIFAVDSPPIWKAFKRTEKSLSITTQIKQTLISRWNSLKKFAELNWPRMFFHLGIFLIVALFLKSVRRRGDSWLEEEGSASRFKYIYHHSFSSALLLSLVFTSYIYQSPPEFVRELNRLLFLIPLLRILPKIIHREMKTPFYWLAALYVVQRLDEVIIDFTLSHRLVLLLITLTTFLGLLWILRPNSPILQRRGGRWRQAMIFSSRIAMIFMGVSLLANIFGNVSLADLLTSATLNISYVGVGVFAAILILESIIIVSIEGKYLSKLRIVQNNSQLIMERIISLVRLLALILWIGFALENFNIYDPLLAFTKNFLSKSWQLGNFSFALGEIFIFIITIWLSILISRFIRFVLEEDVLPRISLPRGVPASISILTNYSILAIGFLIALTAAGIEWSKFALLAGAFGVGIGFGLQNVVNNFISGLILIFERPIKVADTVAVGQLNGVVKRIGIRSSTIRTFDGAEVIVPNGTLIQSEVTNWTLSDRLRRIEVKVGVAYGTDPNKVLEILKKVASENSVVLDNPAPMILFQGFGESSLDFSFRVWTSDYDNWLTFSSEITLEVHNALYKAGIEIPFPQRDLHLRSVDKNVPHLLKPPSGESGQQSKTGLKSKVESSKSDKQKAGENKK